MHLLPCADQRSALGFNDSIAWELGFAKLQAQVTPRSYLVVNCRRSLVTCLR